MRTIIAATIIVLAPFTSRAGDMVPYIAMPTGTGYAVDAKGVRRPNMLCMRDATYAPRPRYPYGGLLRPGLIDTANPLTGGGIYRLEIKLTTGHVGRVSVEKWWGSERLRDCAIEAFSQWRFRPGIWREVEIPVLVRKKWLAVVPAGG